MGRKQRRKVKGKVEEIERKRRRDTVDVEEKTEEIGKKRGTKMVIER
jgi:hypothetical protein